MNTSMVASTSIFAFPSNLILHSNPQLAHFSTPTSIPDPAILRRLSVCCAAKQQSGPVKKPPSTRKKKKKVGGGGGGRESSRELSLDDFDIVDEGDGFGSDGGGGGGGGRESSRELSLDDFDIVDEGDGFGSDGGGVDGNGRYQPLPLPNPPAGFILDEQGKVVLVSNKRIATLVDPTNNFPLECVIRRVFRSSQGDECMLLCPADMPVQILKSKNIEGWSAVNDEEVETILPTAAYALAKMHMHLVYSGYCYTARGGFCYTEDDIVEFRTDDGQDVDGLPTEGIEITCFHLDGSHYMIYTPSDPLLFVAVKDQNSQLRIVDDELLEDPAVISAIDEETEFNALVEEETALLESLLGKR